MAHAQAQALERFLFGAPGQVAQLFERNQDEDAEDVTLLASKVRCWGFVAPPGQPPGGRARALNAHAELMRDGFAATPFGEGDKPRGSSSRVGPPAAWACNNTHAEAHLASTPCPASA